MSDSETTVLKIFRHFSVVPYQMLFLNASTDAQSKPAINRLIDKGMLHRERHQYAYHLTTAGYEAVQRLPRPPGVAARGAATCKH